MARKGEEQRGIVSKGNGTAQTRVEELREESLRQRSEWKRIEKHRKGKDWS